MAMLSGFLPMLSWSRLEGVPVPNHLGIYIIMILAQCFPKVVNLPVPARKAEAARAAKTDLAAQMNLLLCLLLSFGANSTLSVAAGKTQTLNMWFIWGIVALTLVCIGIAIFRTYRR